MSKRCKWLEIEPDRDGKRRARQDRVYYCMYPVGEPPALPVSVTKARHFNWPPHRTWVCLEDCASCPCFCAHK